jgi:sulfite exporter TauE/SafE
MELLWQGLLLGLSTGVFCLGACAPALVPSLLSAAPGWRGGARLVGEVALGRLLAYLGFGALVGWLGTNFDSQALWLRQGAGLATLLLALLLALYLAGRDLGLRRLALCRVLPSGFLKTPVAFGFLAGINPCPPFLLALTAALGAGGALPGMAFFAAFFVGTSLYLLPLVPFGALGRWPSTRLVGRMAGFLAVAAFTFLGLGQLLT